MNDDIRMYGVAIIKTTGRKIAHVRIFNISSKIICIHSETALYYSNSIKNLSLFPQNFFSISAGGEF